MTEAERLRDWLDDEGTQSTPWPESVWTMTVEEYCAAVPDKKLRTAISGLLMRQGWQLAVQNLRRALEEKDCYE